MLSAIKNPVIPQQQSVRQQIVYIKKIKNIVFRTLGIVFEKNSVQKLINVLNQLVKMEKNLQIKFQVAKKEKQLADAIQALDQRQKIYKEIQKIPNQLSQKIAFLDKDLQNIQYKIKVKKQVQQLWEIKKIHIDKKARLQQILTQINNFLKQQQNGTIHQDIKACKNIGEQISKNINQNNEKTKASKQKSQQIEQKKKAVAETIIKKKDELEKIMKEKKNKKKDILELKNELSTIKRNRFPVNQVAINAKIEKTKMYQQQIKTYQIIHKKTWKDEWKRVKVFVFILSFLTLIFGLRLL